MTLKFHKRLAPTQNPSPGYPSKNELYQEQFTTCSIVAFSLRDEVWPLCDALLSLCGVVISLCGMVSSLCAEDF